MEMWGETSGNEVDRKNGTRTMAAGTNPNEERL